VSFAGIASTLRRKAHREYKSHEHKTLNPVGLDVRGFCVHGAGRFAASEVDASALRLCVEGQQNQRS